MKRGWIYWVALDPAIGGEINKTRPAVVLSNDLANRVLNRVIMVPLTTNTDRPVHGEALVTVRGTMQKVMASQLRTVSKQRIGKQLAELSTTDLESVERAILFQLGFSFRGTQP